MVLVSFSELFHILKRIRPGWNEKHMIPIFRQSNEKSINTASFFVQLLYDMCFV